MTIFQKLKINGLDLNHEQNYDILMKGNFQFAYVNRNLNDIHSS